MTLFGLTPDYILVMVCWCLGLFIGLGLLLRLRRGGGTKSFRKKVANVGLSLWLLCVLLTSLELGFAIGYDRTDSFNMSNVSKKWFRKYAEPEQKVLKFGPSDAIVYRDDEPFPDEIPDYTTHLCFLGDSFTFGQGINHSADRFSNLVEKKLFDDAPGKYIVTNLGMWGTDLSDAEYILQNLFEKEYRIDTAVYTLCLNDIEWFDPERANAFYSGEWRSGSDFFLFRDTYFFNLLYFRIQQARQPQVRSYYDFVREYYDGEPWQLMQEKILEIRRLCRDNECEFRLVIFPFLHNLGDDNSFAAVHDQVVTFCEDSDIPVLDLLPEFESHAKERLVVSRFDAHPNELANWYAANEIYKWLSHTTNIEQPRPAIEPLKAERPMPKRDDAE
jgi:hypothetical protein